MPWIKNANNERVYKLSIYAKEELPTWSEVYEEFYLQGYYESRSVDPFNKRWTASDPYWKIPRYKVLLATVCNQFNKMIFEDGYKEAIIKATVDKGVMVLPSGNTAINDIRFTCNVWGMAETKENLQNLCVRLNCAPPIYTIPHPSGKENPFITGYNRIDITDLDTLLFRPVIDLFPGFKGSHDHSIYEPALVCGVNNDDFRTIIDIMIEPFREYFEGTGIGWKDEDGNLISNDHDTNKCITGFDPAM